MSKRSNPGLAAACGLLTLLILPDPAIAQLEEIVVTTRKKAESLQRLPIAVDAITSEQIERRGITSLEDVTKLSPSLRFDTGFGPGDTRATVRGLSNTRGRSNVAFLVDGIDVTTENFITAGSGLLANQRLLNDVERVEVIKGPQSALYGRAAFSGAISYITKDPGDELGGQVRVDAAEDGFIQTDGSIGGPIPGLENIAGIRLSGVYWTEDGHYSNSISGEPLGGGEGYGSALSIVFTPTDTIKIRGRAEYSDDEFDQQPTVRVGPGTSGGRLKLREYPADAITPIEIFDPDNPGMPVIAPPIGGGSQVFTGLLDQGQYCPESLKDPARGPGMCLPETFGDAGDQPPPAFSEDPATGQDYEGTTAELFRASLVATLDTDFGTFSSYTGWTDYDTTEARDQDHTAIGRPDTMLAHQQTLIDTTTDQFSQELRFASNFDGPVNFTVGGFHWDEARTLGDENFIISCIQVGVDGSQQAPNRLVQGIPGICDGTNGTVSSWQELYQDLFPCIYDPVTGAPVQDSATGGCVQGPRTRSPWRADTEHWSLYGAIDFEIAENLTLTAETRFIEEDFDIMRPNFSSCSNIGAPFGTVPFLPLTAEGTVTTGADDVVCRAEPSLNPDLPAAPLDPNGNDWILIQGSESSSFSTPKVTLEFTPTDDALVYASWARAQKPAGINPVAAGGTAVTIEDSRFDAEKMETWEIGWKTSWEAAGYLQFNGALFFNDYTDKQVGTQVLVEQAGGAVSLQPRVVNASAAQVWGLEIDMTYQPSFVEGLTLTAGYTHLDAEFTDFVDNTRSIQRAAMTGNCNLAFLDENNQVVPPITTAEPFCQMNLNGNQLERSPEHAFAGNIQMTRPIPGTEFEWFAELTATYEDERFIDADNFIRFDPYWLVDTRLGLTAESWEFLLYVNNLLDDETIRTGGRGPDFANQVTELGFTAGLGVTGWFGTLPPPRIFGARLTLRF